MCKLSDPMMINEIHMYMLTVIIFNRQRQFFKEFKRMIKIRKEEENFIKK